MTARGLELMSTSRIEAFRAMLAKDSSKVLARFGLANELIKSAEFETARAELEEYVTASDDEGAAYRLLARAYEGLGRRDDAIDAYRRGIDAATRHNHPSMVAEFEMKIEDLEG